MEITALAAIIAGSELTVGLVAEESPPYLMAMGRLDEAEAAIRRIAVNNLDSLIAARVPSSPSASPLL